ncbi:MAG: hypothetical protein R3250_02170 [Melioribacteraceae bacterium]|nr:hypothetical protein [Melioribacteraceae bacterium]
MTVFNDVLDFLRKKFSDFELVPKVKGVELQPIPQRNMHKVFEDLDKDDNLNEEARDFLIGEIEKIMKRQGKGLNNTFEFCGQEISCRVETDGNVILNWIRPADNRHSIPVFFNGKKSYPLKVWLEEQILTNEDVIELEKGLIRML